MSDTFKGKTILIVDDDADVVAAISAALTDSGATVLTAGDGNLAVEVNEKQQPDLVILDMMLPKRGGFLVLGRIRQGKPKGAKPRVIMITANPGSRHKVYAESVGADDYINKPFRMDRLFSSMEKLLGDAPAGTVPKA